MGAPDEPLEERIEQLLENDSLRDDPLFQPLEELWAAHRDLARRIERISRISDAYQSLTKENEKHLTKRLDKQLRQLSKVARISDHYQKMMHDLNLALREASTHDPLTGLGNRRLLLERLKEETDRSHRYARPLSIAMLDIDYFKRVNDDHGHELGDQVLMEVSRVMDAQIRDQDMCGRWGGEEFLIILPETNISSACQVLDRVREAIAALRMRVGDESITVTASIGVASHRDADTYSDTINQADWALLTAKRSGRNRLARADEIGTD
ncbi:biofilm regulation diguanylate cyclase SiaD [Halopseudomonas salina]|uniref:diguanylate cyclase n=1 Tax=Halopseudomonas salina TaxID=1323744 RepID=A0ABQ1PEY8_9GAMM|nr:biofilm regulation diguanylate cyclase SiaD [Halopseudomonas salina]GGC95829.1 GGDEF domain-containing protein [Halopseudomonas salina]